MQPKRCNSSLTAAYYQQLLDLLDKAISSGDLSGGSAFDRNALLKLESQAQSFASLPLGTAGVRVMDDSFNYPLGLLEARLKALVAEAGNFTTVSGRLLDIMSNETRCLPFRSVFSPPFLSTSGRHRNKHIQIQCLHVLRGQETWRQGSRPNASSPGPVQLSLTAQTRRTYPELMRNFFGVRTYG